MQDPVTEAGQDIVQLIEAFNQYNDHSSEIDFGTIQKAYRGLSDALNTFSPEVPHMNLNQADITVQRLEEHFSMYLKFYKLCLDNIKKHGSNQAQQGVSYLEKAYVLLKERARLGIRAMRKTLL